MTTELEKYQQARIEALEKENQRLRDQKQKTFNEKRGLQEVQLKDPKTCEYFKEVGCIKDTCICYTLKPKQETLEEFAERLCPNKQVEYDMILEGAKWQQEQDKKLYSKEEVLKFSEWFAFELTHYGYPTEENIIKALKEIKRILNT